MSYIEELENGWSLTVRNMSANYFTIDLSKNDTIVGGTRIDKKCLC